jgi:hypothetical protein
MGQTTTMAEETRQGSNRVAAQEEKSWNEPVLGLALPIFIVGSCLGPATGQYGLWAIIAECGYGKTGPHSYYLGLDLLWAVIIVVQLDGLCSRMPTHPQT